MIILLCFAIDCKRHIFLFHYLFGITVFRFKTQSEPFR